MATLPEVSRAARARAPRWRWTTRIRASSRALSARSSALVHAATAGSAAIAATTVSMATAARGSAGPAAATRTAASATSATKSPASATASRASPEGIALTALHDTSSVLPDANVTRLIRPFNYELFIFQIYYNYYIIFIITFIIIIIFLIIN